MHIKNEISELIDNGKITKAIKIFVEYIKENNEDLYDEVLGLKERNKTNRADKTLDKISNDDYIKRTEKLTVDLYLLIDKVKEEKPEILELDDLLIPKKIFMSYYTSELETAKLIKKMLISAGAVDIVELEEESGESSSELLSQQIDKSDVILSVVSNKPQEAAWLAMETVHLFYTKKAKEKNFIAVYLDSDFLDWRYQMDGNLKLSKKIKELDSSMSEGLGLGNDFLILKG